MLRPAMHLSRYQLLSGCFTFALLLCCPQYDGSEHSAYKTAKSLEAEFTFLLMLPLLFFLAAAGHLHVTQGVICQQMPEPPSVEVFHS